MNLNDIGVLVRSYADDRDALAEVVDAVRDVQRRAVRERIRTIRTRVAATSTSRDRLRDAIDGARGLFDKPRTQSLHGVKFGLRKMPGRIEGDMAEAIRRIDRRMPDREPELVQTRRSLDKRAVLRLSARELASIGLSLVHDDDQIVIAAASNDLDKLVDAMLADDDG